MKDGFLKAAAFSPALRVADCTYNAQQILADVQAAAARGVKLAVFPEFCLTGYTCGDLFLQHTLQTGALDALQTVLGLERQMGPLSAEQLATVQKIALAEEARARAIAVARMRP